MYAIENFQKEGNAMNVLEIINGRSPFELVLEHTMKVRECVELLRPLTEAFLDDNYSQIEELHRRMSETEHNADIVKDRIRQRLSEVYLLSVRRDELNSFISVQDHARRTETALKGIVFYECFLNRMQFSVFCQAFNGENIFTFDAPDGKRAWPSDSVVNYNSARTAHGFTATILRTGQTQIGPQYP